MKVKPSDFVTDMTGSIAGTTYQRNRYGLIRRAKPNPSNPQTDRQQARRSFFGSISSGWRGLTEEQRLGWIALAETAGFIPIFGEPKPQTGNTLYIACNQNLLTVAEDTIEDAVDPPSFPATTDLEFDELDATHMAINQHFAATPADQVPDDFDLAIFITPSLSAGISKPSASKFRLVAVANHGVNTAPFDLFTNYSDTFGPPVTGDKIFLRTVLIHIASGFSGVPFQTSGIVA